MRNRIRRKELKELLQLLDSLPETNETFGTFWLHEQAIMLTLYGYQSRGLRRRLRGVLKELEAAGEVEHRKWEMGISWRLSKKP